MTRLRAVELFAGGGGLALGAEAAGFEHVALLEWYRPACETLRQKKEWRDAVIEADVRGTYDAFDRWRREGLDVIAGGPPCQPFSTAGSRRGEEDPRDMWPHAVRAVDQARPRAFLFENVKGLLARKFAAYRQDVILGPLERLGYDVQPMRRLVSADWGVPQKRERVFTVGFKKSIGVEWQWPAPTHSEAALFAAQWVDGSYWREHGLPAPEVPTELVERVERIRPPPLPRWQTVRDAIGDPSLPADEPVNEKGVYETHELDAPAFTITATHRNNKRLRMGGGRGTRYFTVDELAALQGFPNGWPFAGSDEERTVQIGNAVPPAMGEAVMLAIARTLRAADHD